MDWLTFFTWAFIVIGLFLLISGVANGKKKAWVSGLVLLIAALIVMLARWMSGA